MPDFIFWTIKLLGFCLPTIYIRLRLVVTYSIVLCYFYKQEKRVETQVYPKPEGFWQKLDWWLYCRRVMTTEEPLPNDKQEMIQDKSAGYRNAALKNPEPRTHAVHEMIRDRDTMASLKIALRFTAVVAVTVILGVGSVLLLGVETSSFLSVSWNRHDVVFNLPFAWPWWTLPFSALTVTFIAAFLAMRHKTDADEERSLRRILYFGVIFGILLIPLALASGMLSALDYVGVIALSISSLFVVMLTLNTRASGVGLVIVYCTGWPVFSPVLLVGLLLLFIGVSSLRNYRE